MPLRFARREGPTVPVTTPRARASGPLGAQTTGPIRGDVVGKAVELRTLGPKGQRRDVRRHIIRKGRSDRSPPPCRGRTSSNRAPSWRPSSRPASEDSQAKAGTSERAASGLLHSPQSHHDCGARPCFESTARSSGKRLHACLRLSSASLRQFLARSASPALKSAGWRISRT